MKKSTKRAVRRQRTFNKMKARLRHVKEICKTYFENTIKRHCEGYYRKSSAYGSRSCCCCPSRIDKLIGRRPKREQPFRDEVEYEQNG